MFGIVPPDRRGLDVDIGGLDFLDEFFCSISESVGGVSGSNKIQFSTFEGILEYSECVFKGIISVSNSIVDTTINIRLS
jgi:hypothetical protein